MNCKNCIISTKNYKISKNMQLCNGYAKKHTGKCPAWVNNIIKSLAENNKEVQNELYNL